MKTQRIKLHYNNLMRMIDETLGSDDTEAVKNNAFGIGIGLELLTEYMKNIAERALELNDEVLIGLLLDMYLLEEKERPQVGA